MRDIGFCNPPLDDMVAVGAMEAESARIWMRLAEPAAVEVRWVDAAGRRGCAPVTIDECNERDNTASVLLEGLKPLTRYRYEVVRAADGNSLGAGQFETSPGSAREVPDRFVLGLMSCHQPFANDGRVTRGARRMLRATLRCLRRHDAKMVLQVGDQQYSDLPRTRSLLDERYFRRVGPPDRSGVLDCSPEETRRLYQERYRHFFALPEWQALHAEFPCYPILDDHDIVDNWGSDPAHSEPRWLNVIEGARRAYLDYQGSRVRNPGGPLPASFDYEVVYGSMAVRFVDLRSNRRSGKGARVVSDEQMRKLEAFLARHVDKGVLFLVFSVPPVHLPRALARLVAKLRASGEDFSDRWSSGGHLEDRDRLLHVLAEHQSRYPAQHVALLSGDIHIGCLHRIEWVRGGTCHQFISSGITHLEGRIMRWGSRAIMHMNHRVRTADGDVSARVRLVKGRKGARTNPCAHFNLGIVEVRRRTDADAPDVRYRLYGHIDGEPRLLFRS